MNLVTHLFKKDFRHARVLLIVWMLLIVLQFTLASAGANPADRVMQELLTMISVLVPVFQALVLIALIPQVVQEEPLVGTTAFWFTRPISRATLLKAKTLFAVLVLVLPPLIVEIIVLAANGVTPHDLALAVPEIVMGRLVLILIVAMLAVVTPNFARFAIVGVAILIGILVLTMTISYTRMFMDSENFVVQAQNFSLEKSRQVLTDLLIILAGGAAVAHQYLTRKTVRSIILAGVGAALILAAENFWPWDFLAPPPIGNAAAPFDLSGIKAEITTKIWASDVSSIRGEGLPLKSIQTTIDAVGLPPAYLLQTKRVISRVTLPDGQSLAVKNSNQISGLREPDADNLEAALGMPVANADNRSYYTTTLFTIDADTYGKNLDKPLALSADIDFAAFKYVVAAEMPLTKGARHDHGSEHLVITDILREPNGLKVMLRERRVRLLFDRKNNTAEVNMSFDPRAIYLLRNKKRNEAVMQKNDYGSFVTMSTPSRLVNEPVQLSFGPEQNRNRLTPDLTTEWLADADLVRLDRVPVADFSKSLVVEKFQLNGENSFFPHSAKVKKTNDEALRKIVLPDHATKEQVKEYINAVLVASQRQDSIQKNGPQIEMLAKVGPENLDALIEAKHRSNANVFYYAGQAIKRLARAEDKELILQALPGDHDLVEIVAEHGWQAEVRDTLIAELGRKPDYLPETWIKAVASFQDPSTYEDLKCYLIRGSNRQDTFNAIKDLPGIDLTAAVDEAWKKAKYQSLVNARDACGMAAEFGHADALGAAAKILQTVKENNWRRIAREVLQKFTPATGDDAALLAWFEANKEKLKFDSASKKFVPEQ